MAILAANIKISMKKIVRSLSKIKPVNGRLESWQFKKQFQGHLRLRSHPRSTKSMLQNIRSI